MPSFSPQGHPFLLHALAPTSLPVALKGPGLPATPGLIPQRFFKAPILASSCNRLPVRGPGAGLPEAPAVLNTPHWGTFGGLTRKPLPLQGAQRPRCCGSQLPGASSQPRRLLKSSVLTHSGGSTGAEGPPWGKEPHGGWRPKLAF